MQRAVDRLNNEWENWCRKDRWDFTSQSLIDFWKQSFLEAYCETSQKKVSHSVNKYIKLESTILCSVIILITLLKKI